MAEISSIVYQLSAIQSFQCSSASRKFLNWNGWMDALMHPARFSALQRAENSSIEPVALHERIVRIVSVLFSEPKIPQSDGSDVDDFDPPAVSVLFSEPKIPQYFRLRPAHHLCVVVSVLFSEPKIPQSPFTSSSDGKTWSFSALQRAENSSILCRRVPSHARLVFQCSSASRKFLNEALARCVWALARCFSALQRAENSSIA